VATTTLTAKGVAVGTVITVTGTDGTLSGNIAVTAAAPGSTSAGNLTVLASSLSMPSNNSAPVTITAQLENNSNQLLPGVAVSFQASSGAIAPVATAAGAAASPAVPAGTTDANGKAQATLSTLGNLQNRVITVTVTAGTSSATIQVTVVGTQLVIGGPSSLVLNAQGTYSITLTDSGGVGIAGQTVALTSALGNTLTPSSVTTGSTGTATFTLTGVTGGNDTLTATGEGITATQAVTVSNQNLVFAAPLAGATIDVTTPTTPVSLSVVPVSLLWTVSGAGQTGTVDISTSRGTLSTSTLTVTGGVFSPANVTLSSNTAGPAVISATAINSSGTTVATTQVAVNFIATVPNTVSVQANPSTVPVQGQSTITALVTDPNGNPVQGASVSFNLTDPTGGNLSTSAATTSVQGQATVTYTAGAISSAAKAVSITVAVQGVSSTITSATTLTVGGQTVSLTLGTGGVITAYSSTQFAMPWTVSANDSANHPVSNVTVILSLQSLSYETGSYSFTTVAPETAAQWNPTIDAPQPGDGLIVPGIGGCAPVSVWELNGVIQTAKPLPSPIPSDWVLTSIPGSVVSVNVGSTGSVVTGADGSATVNLIYPQNYATWVAVALTGTANVAGTQNSTTASFVLPALATNFTATSSPPFEISPFGQYGSCYINQTAP
jgi:hypothetical protein